MTASRSPLTRPRRLSRGDRVAVVATSGPLPPERLARGVATLESWGLDVSVGEHALESRRHLAGTDEQRAADLQTAWCDPSVRAVVCGRGGSGAARVVDLVDWDAMRAAGPRVLVGFSDVTVLHQAVARRLGLVSLMGPMAATEVFAGDDPDPDSIAGLRAALMDPQSARTLAAGTLHRVVGGCARGPVVGGTISLLAQSAGTADQVPAGGAVAVLEDVGEPTYRLDALVTQLLRTGWFDGVAGVVLGTFQGCGRDAQEVVAERLQTLGVPLATGLPFGHGRPQLTVPLGVETDLDVDAGTLVLRQPALR